MASNRVQHLLCSREQPCGQCKLRYLGQTCQSLATEIVVTPGPNTRNGGQEFYDFYNQITVIYGNIACPRTQKYWWHGIFSAAQDDECLMDAILCKNIINWLPKDRVLSCILPSQALRYYSRSLNQMNTSRNFTAFLLVTNMYMEIEWQMGRYENINTLARVAFSVWYSKRDSILFASDTFTLAILIEFALAISEGPADISGIPIQQWNAYYLLVLSMAVELKVAQLEILDIQLIDLMFRLHHSKFTSAELTWKVIAWEHNLTYYTNFYPSDSPERRRCGRMQFRFWGTKLLWIHYNWRHQPTNNYFKNAFQETLQKMTTWFEAWISTMDAGRVRASPFFQHGLFNILLPRMLEIVHCSRNKVICERIIKVLRELGSSIAYCQNFINYLEELVQTEEEQPTIMETECFGQFAGATLDKEKLHRLTDHIAIQWTRNAGISYA